jgi:hypothetical protein
MFFELLTAVLPAVSLLAVAALAVAACVVIQRVVAQSVVAVPRSRAIGGRSRDHAVLLRVLPASSHPDAAGHARSRAPGSLVPVA